MKLYHASPTGGLTVLKPRVSRYFGKPEQVCLTKLKPMALLYGIKHYEYTYGYTKGGRLYYEEYFADALEELYRGKSASLYVCSWREGMEETQIPNEFVSADEVPVEEEILIPDVCQALLAEEREGTMDIVRWNALSAKRREWIVQAEAEVIREKNLLGQDCPMAQYMRENYPESWNLVRQEMEVVS